MEDQPKVNAVSINSAVRRLGVAHRSRTADLLIRHGVRIGSELLLLELAHRKESTQAALAQAAGTEASTITVALRKLESAGLVERTKSPKDARAHTVRLTATGQELIRDLEGVQQTVADRIVAGLADSLDAETFVAVAERIIAELEG